MNDKLNLFIFVLIINLIIVINCERHPECGEPPTTRYKDLAKLIGNFTQFKFECYKYQIIYKNRLGLA